MRLRASSLPPLQAALGAARSYFITILSHNGFTPMAVIDHITGDADQVVNDLVKIFTALDES